MDIKTFVHNQYDIEVDKLRKLDGGFRNNCFHVFSKQGDFIFIIYKSEKNIKNLILNAHFISKFLISKGFKTRIPIKSKSDQEISKFKIGGKYHFAALYNYLKGFTIPWEAYTRRHIKSIGKTLSDMHYSLRNIEIPKRLDLPIWKGVTLKEIRKMKIYFRKVEPWITRKLKVKLDFKKIDKLFNDIELLEYPKTNVLHYDFVRGNILFSKKLDKNLDIYPIIGILDFEKVCIGPDIADAARTLAFLIVDCKYKSEETVRKRFLISGYNKRGKNRIEYDQEDLDNLTYYFWLRDFWKFLEHNPYEYLHMNEHYKRTERKLEDNNFIKHKI